MELEEKLFFPLFLSFLAAAAASSCFAARCDSTTSVRSCEALPDDAAGAIFLGK